MICPNCKTELVEVNGRYICSDCGREIPENEVMASDWGNGGTARAGLYGAGTDEKPEESNTEIAEFNTSLTESENVETLAAPETATAVSDEPTVEQVLQTQATAEVENTTVSPEPDSGPVPDTGFYAPEATATPVIPVQELESSPGSFPPKVGQAVTTQDDVNIPVSVPEIPVVIPKIPESVPTPEPAPTQPEAVKDMFENAEIATAPPLSDPGLYTDPMYDVTQGNEQSECVSAPTNAPMSGDKRTNMIVLIIGSVLVLLLIIGGTWGYLAVNKKVNVEVPVVGTQETTWQELQVVDGGFKINFPGTPEKAENEQTINGKSTSLTSYGLATDDIMYSASYALLEAADTKVITDSLKTTLPVLVNEIATAQNLTVAKTQIGKYYTADAIDFTLTSDTANYQGKIMIKGNSYIVIMAGSTSGQSTEYDKFIKSFNFIAST